MSSYDYVIEYECGDWIGFIFGKNKEGKVVWYRSKLLSRGKKPCIDNHEHFKFPYLQHSAFNIVLPRVQTER